MELDNAAADLSARLPPPNDTPAAADSWEGDGNGGTAGEA